MTGGDSAGSPRALLLRVLRQGKAERVPVAPFIHVNYVKEFFGTHDVDWVARTPEVYAFFGFDLIHRNCSIAYDAYGPAGPGWTLEVRRERQGRDETTTTRIRTPDGELSCREALRWVYEYDAEVSALEYPVRSKADFERMRKWQPAPAPADVTDIRRAREAVGEEGIIAPWIQGAFNCVAYYYRKLDELLLDAALDPGFYRAMMEHFVARYKGFVQQLIDAGVDMLSYGANIANGKLVSPEFYRAHIQPYEKDLIDFIQGQGVPVLFHNCGYARRLLPLYAELGLRAYESLTPPPYGDTLLAEALEAFGGRTTLAGGIDQLDLLRKGSPGEIEEAVKGVLRAVGGRHPFILGTTDYFNENTPRGNIAAFAEAARRYGAP